MTPQEAFAQALTLYRQGDLAQAEKLLLVVRQALPQDPSVLKSLGVVLRRQGRAEESLPLFAAAGRLSPNDGDAIFQTACALRGLGRQGEALAALTEAAALSPERADIQTNLANCLRDLGREEEALRHDHRAIALDPTSALAHTNLAVGLCRIADFAGALASLNRALEHDAAYALAHWNRALTRLVLGDLPGGFAEYRWGFPAGERGAPRHTGLPSWTGEALTAGELVLYGEQGLGDCVQMLRFLPEVSRRCPGLIVELPPELLTLARRLIPSLAGPCRFVAYGETPPDAVAQAPLLDLPALLKIDLAALATLPAPYLQAEPRKIAAWKTQLNGQPGHKIGLRWSGNPRHRNNSARSLAAERLAPLASLSGVTFISLQHGPEASERPPGLPILHPQGLSNDFSDAAALYAALDLIISVDTSVVHVAGALGCPVWLLLPEVPDWRWLLERGDSPWYPSLRLFRQPRRGDWDSVIARVTRELLQLFAL